MAQAILSTRGLLFVFYIHFMKTILIALDQNEESEKLLEYGQKLASKFDSKVCLVHIAAPEPDFVGYKVGPQYIRDFRAKELKEEHKYLVDLAETLSRQGIEAQGVLLEGFTADMIVEESEKLEADLIILGSHKHSFLYRVFVGDTTESVLKKSKIPLLVIPVSD